MSSVAHSTKISDQSDQYESWRRTTLAFFHAVGVGPKQFQEILEHYASMEAVHAAALRGALPEKVQSAWSQAMAHSDDFVEQLRACRLSYVCCWEKAYPALLKLVADPPIILTYMGDLAIVNKADERVFAVVGNRAISAPAEVVTREVCTDLTRRGHVVVSGMAMGVDFVALEAAIAVGPAVAVLASAANDPTPHSNRRLYNQILGRGGLVLSETWPGTPMIPGLFPRRNRIIAGMSQATLVVEAGDRSGALITAQQASGYGREVFAVPWSWTHPAQGTNRLIRDNIAQVYLHDDLVLSEQFDPGKDLPPAQQVIINKIAAGVNDIDALAIELAQPQTALLSLILDLEIRSVVSEGADGKYYLSK